MLFWTILAATVFFGSAATAQTTNCYPNNPMMPSAGVHCDTTGGFVPQGSGEGTLDFFRALHVRAENKKVGSLIADGKCDEARKEALRDGDLTLAEHVQRLCTDPAHP